MRRSLLGITAGVVGLVLAAPSRADEHDRYKEHFKRLHEHQKRQQEFFREEQKRYHEQQKRQAEHFREARKRYEEQLREQAKRQAEFYREQAKQRREYFREGRHPFGFGRYESGSGYPLGGGQPYYPDGGGNYFPPARQPYSPGYGSPYPPGGYYSPDRGSAPPYFRGDIHIPFDRPPYYLPRCDED